MARDEPGCGGSERSPGMGENGGMAVLGRRRVVPVTMPHLLEVGGVIVVGPVVMVVGGEVEAAAAVVVTSAAVRLMSGETGVRQRRRGSCPRSEDRRQAQENERAPRPPHPPIFSGLGRRVNPPHLAAISILDLEPWSKADQTAGP